MSQLDPSRTALHITCEPAACFSLVKVAVIGFFPKFTNPGAVKRKFVLVPANLG